MTSRVLKYTDYNGTEQEREFYFNLTEAEVAEMHLTVKGGMAALMRQIVETHDTPTLIKIFKDMVLNAYGEKSLDGQRFVKTPEIKKMFEDCPAYSVLFMSMLRDQDYAAKFLQDIMPDSIKQENLEESIKEAEKQLSAPAKAGFLAESNSTMQ